jgi:CRISPR-associated protein Cmr6
MARGKVSQWNGSIGHITDEADGARVFFGDRALRGLRPGDIHLGMDVEFDRVQDDRGPAARNVRRPGAEAARPPRPASPRAARPQPAGGGPSAIAGRSNIPTPPNVLPLPGSLRRVVDSMPLSERHPGLQLDKYSRGGEQTEQKEALRRVVESGRDAALLQDLRRRRDESLQALGARAWCRTTSGPLTLHLARAAAMENAGICVHPVYGFAYLPGTGLKGMARAYAETIWAPAQPDPSAAWQIIERVFGWAPGSDTLGKGVVKPWKPQGVPEHGKDAAATAGDIIFHDAWPAGWPQLLVDIVNNHHPTYYQGDDPPGDWDSPVPVYFLAVAGGQEFSFALARRRPDVPGEWLDLAQQWLDGALTLLGCGAKTVAGYGYFTGPLPAVAARPGCTVTLELVTPALLAGANQLGAGATADCDLRPATLRGLLRWWWRAVHTGFVDVAALKRLEAVVWGDTDAGGAVSIVVERVGAVRPELCPFKTTGQSGQGKAILKGNEAFLRQHGIPPTTGRLTQGLLYHSFGMDEMPAGRPDERKQRQCMPAGARWRVRLMSRPATFSIRDAQGREIHSQRLPADLLLEQAQLALWWLCRLGGIGSKARKGFGSFADPPELTGFEGHKWKSRGQAFRGACGLPPGEFRPEWADSSSLQMMRELAREVLGDNQAWLEIPADGADPWFVLDRVGAAAQAFAQAGPDTGHGKHCAGKIGLGLPRKIHRAPGEELLGVRGDRFASPVWYHVGRSEDGRQVVRVSAFPSRELRPPGVSSDEGLRRHRELLTQLLLHLQDDLPKRLQEVARGGGPPAGRR